MKLHRLTLTNFGSFRGEQTFRFPEEPGLYFMQGVNVVQPRLEANGSGKTTLWRALTWLFFAKDARGLKAGDVCNWETGKQTKVELAFDADVEKGAISMRVMARTWGPNSWTMQDLFGNTTDLTKDQSNPVLALLRLEFTPFLNSILMAQGQPMFLDLKHDAKAALFSDVLGLDLWLDYSAKASKKASAQDLVSRQLERDLSAMRATLAQIQGQDLAKHSEQWKAERNARLDDLEARYSGRLLAHKKAKAGLPGFAEVAEQCRQAFQEYRVDVEQAQTRTEKSYDKLQGLREAKAVALAKYKSETELQEEGTCPTCGQDLPHKHDATSKTRLKQLLQDLDAAELAVFDGVDCHDIVLASGDKVKATHADLRDLADAAEEAERRAKREVQQIERELDVMEEDAERIQAEKNPYAELQALQRREGERVVVGIADTQRLLDDSNSRYSMFSFWVRGFKEVRLQLIAEALVELEIEVNNCVMSLGLVDWELNFLVDRETKSGNIQRGFNVVVSSPHNAKPVPWEAWSGGEAQRLRVAAQQGLANLIRSRTGTGLNLEVWDEPSTGLSQQGIRDLLESLATRARQEQRQIWVVDHTAHSFGGFAGGAVITKTSRGSAIAQ